MIWSPGTNKHFHIHHDDWFKTHAYAHPTVPGLNLRISKYFLLAVVQHGIACGHKTRAIAYKQHKFCLITYSKSDKNVLENLSQCAWCWRRRQTHLAALTFFRLVGFSKTAFAHINHIHHFSVAFKRSICLAILGPLHVRIGNKCCGHFNYLHHFGFFPFILHVACVWVSYLLELHHHHHTLAYSKHVFFDKILVKSCVTIPRTFFSIDAFVCISFFFLLKKIQMRAGAINVINVDVRDGTLRGAEAARLSLSHCTLD